MPTPDDVSTETSQLLRCPRCEAQLRLGTQWCTLCYLDLRPAPAPSPAPASVEDAVSQEPAPDQATEVPPAAVPRGRHARQPARVDAEPLTPAAAPAAVTTRSRRRTGPVLPEAEVAALLAQLAAAESGEPLGRFAGHLDSPARKVALIIGGTVVAMVALVLVMAVLGVLL